MDPQGRFAYAVTVNIRNTSSSEVRGMILGYEVRDGVLTPLPGSPFARPANPQGITVTPDGTFLYITNWDGSIAGFAINQRTGALAPLAGPQSRSGKSPSGIASCRRIGNRCKPARG